MGDRHGWFIGGIEEGGSFLLDWRRFIRHPSLSIVVVEVEGVHCVLGDEPWEHVSVAAGWSKACWAFTFVNGTEIGGLNIAEGVELRDAILIPIGVAVIEGSHRKSILPFVRWRYRSHRFPWVVELG